MLLQNRSDVPLEEDVVRGAVHCEESDNQA
jgi:hypothetical protein